MLLLRVIQRLAGGTGELAFKVAHGGLAAETNFAGALVDTDALHGDGISPLDDVFGAAHALLGEFADVAEAFFAGCALDEATEVPHVDNKSLFNLTISAKTLESDIPTSSTACSPNSGWLKNLRE